MQEGASRERTLGSERKTSNGDASERLASDEPLLRRAQTHVNGNGAGNGNGHGPPPPPKTWRKPVIEELSSEEGAAARERLKDVPSWHEGRGEN